MRLSLLPDERQKTYFPLFILIGVIVGLLAAELSSPYFCLLAIGAPILIGALFLYPELGMTATIFAIWFEHGLVNYNPVITVSKALVVLTGLSILANLACKRLKWQSVRITVPLLGWLGIMLFSLFYTPFTQNGIDKILTFCSHIALVFLVVQSFQDKIWVKFTLGGIVGISLLQALQSFITVRTVDVHASIARASGNYVDPNVFARGLLTSLTICILYWILKKGFVTRTAGLAVSVVLMGAIFITGSRSSVVICLALFFILVLVFLFTQSFSWLRLAKQLVMIAVVISLFVAAGSYLIDLVPKAYTQRIMNMFDQGLTDTAVNNGRATLFYAAADAIALHPLKGVGIGGFDIYVGSVKAFYPHNIFLETGAELGLGGIICLAALMFLPFYAGVKELRRNRGEPTNYMLMAMALAGFMTNLFYAQFIGQITSHKPLWIFIGLILALENMLADKHGLEVNDG